MAETPHLNLADLAGQLQRQHEQIIAILTNQGAVATQATQAAQTAATAATQAVAIAQAAAATQAPAEQPAAAKPWWKENRITGLLAGITLVAAIWTAMHTFAEKADVAMQVGKIETAITTASTKSTADLNALGTRIEMRMDKIEGKIDAKIDPMAATLSATQADVKTIKNKLNL